MAPGDTTVGRTPNYIVDLAQLFFLSVNVCVCVAAAGFAENYFSTEPGPPRPKIPTDMPRIYNIRQKPF